MKRILLAKTALDGHWRGVDAVARALRDASFEVVYLGMARADEIARSAVDEDVDLVGLNVGGRVEVVERIITAVRDERPEVPIVVGGTVAPWVVRRLAEQDVPAFPPGTAVSTIVADIERLTDTRAGPDADER